MNLVGETDPLRAVVVVGEVEDGGGEAGVHDDEAGEPLGRVLHHAEASEAAPVLAHQRDVPAETFTIYSSRFWINCT